MWSYLSPEQRVPRDHPLRPIRASSVCKDASWIIPILHHFERLMT
jgi:hypothetical protein